jgi:hypothetical protein
LFGVLAKTRAAASGSFLAYYVLDVQQSRFNKVYHAKTPRRQERKETHLVISTPSAGSG